MDAILLDRAAGLRTFALVFKEGDQFSTLMRDWLQEAGVSSASFTAIGACQSVTLGYFDLAAREYARIPVEEQAEVLTLAGNVAVGPDGSPRVHAHVSVGLRDGSARGGHLLEATIRPTLELILTEHPPHLRRRSDPETGLALLVTPTPMTADKERTR
jgi:predicted DNA-binding protein with PD1-like motif